MHVQNTILLVTVIKVIDLRDVYLSGSVFTYRNISPQSGNVYQTLSSLNTICPGAGVSDACEGGPAPPGSGRFRGKQVDLRG